MQPVRARVPVRRCGSAALISTSLIILAIVSEYSKITGQRGGEVIHAETYISTTAAYIYILTDSYIGICCLQDA